jgi:dihydrodipicolinate synthase/N-acetylneuraminate lyase
MKVAMEILGMPAGPVRPPLNACKAQDVQDIRDLMKVYADMVDAKAAAI